MNATIQFTCPLCKKQMKLPATTVGRQGNCPGCKQVVTIQVDSPQPEQRQQTSITKIHFTCPQCGKKMQLPATTVGQQGTCPDCKQPVIIQPDISAPAPGRPGPLVAAAIEPQIPNQESTAATPMLAGENLPPGPVQTMAGVQGQEQTAARKPTFFSFYTDEDAIYDIDLEDPIAPFSLEAAGDKSRHSIKQGSSVFLVTVATVFSGPFMPFFFYFWFMRFHGKLPKLTESDPTSLGHVVLYSVLPYRAIGFVLIPLWPVYLSIWNWHVLLRLCDRINLQLLIRGKEPTAPTEGMRMILMLGFVGFLIFPIFLVPVLLPVYTAKLQRSINELAACSTEQ